MVLPTKMKQKKCFNQRFSVKQLCDAFYFSDPMGTCCVENECVDEYALVAEHTKACLDKGNTLYEAVDEALRLFFEGLVEPHHTTLVLNQIKPEKS